MILPFFDSYRISFDKAPKGRIVISDVIIMEPSFRVIILIREPQIIRDRADSNRRFAEGFVVRRPDNGPGSIRNLLRGS